ncbi:TetR/AcrR family transcriptional regulator [Pseudonocardia sp. NPDC046786]|uniref:TetR/AcrR family transcriptional regulator n=1 Tax=Pseudonocardia sp. NPDC046786 TaxID=3155471 RepID=UPI0033ECE8ED
MVGEIWHTDRRARRRRDPDRPERILAAAARLAAGRGFHTVGMAEIGSEAGIVGSGVYRHFASKEAILIALLDRGMTRLESGAAAALRHASSDQEALFLLVRDYAEVALTHRAELTVYHRESHTLPDEHRRSLRRRQRHYVEEWVHTLAPLRQDLSDAELRLAVHAATGAIQSTLFFRSGLTPELLTERLVGMAHGCLGVVPYSVNPN